MKYFLFFLLQAFAIMSASASVFLPHDIAKGQKRRNSNGLSGMGGRAFGERRSASNKIGQQFAMAIPGYSLTEQIFIGGTTNFLNIYNILLTGRILLSWIPQAQGVAALQPLFQITDPFLSLFRGIIPPVFGLDLSPIASFFLLSTVTKATVAVGAEIPMEMRKKLMKKKRYNLPSAVSQGIYGKFNQ